MVGRNEKRAWCANVGYGSGGVARMAARGTSPRRRRDETAPRGACPAHASAGDKRVAHVRAHDRSPTSTARPWGRRRAVPRRRIRERPSRVCPSRGHGSEARCSRLADHVPLLLRVRRIAVADDAAAVIVPVAVLTYVVRHCRRRNDVVLVLVIYRAPVLPFVVRRHRRVKR